MNVINASYPKLALMSLLLMMCFSYKIKAQSKQPVSYYFKTDTVLVDGNTTFSNALVIRNGSTRTLNLVRDGLNAEVDQAILKLPEMMVLKAGESRSFPLKYFANIKTIKKNAQAFLLKLKSTDQFKGIQESAAFYIQLKNPNGLIMDTQSYEIYLDPLTNKAAIDLRLFNDGLIPLAFRLELTEIPKGLEFLGSVGEMELQPGESKFLPLVALNKSKNNNPADFWVTIRALDKKGGALAVRRIRIMTVSSNRNLVLNEQQIYYTNRPNTVSLNYVTANAYQALQLFGAGRIDLNNDRKLSYNLNLTYSPLTNRGRLYPSDTYLEYKTPKWAVKAGNLYANLDFNLYGSGVKGSWFLGKGKTLSAYAVENNNFLFSSLGSANQGGNTFALEYSNGQPSIEKTHVVLLKNKDLMSGMNTAIVSGKQELIKTQDEQLNVGGGYSLQSPVELNDKRISGFGLELNYEGKVDFGQFSSSNYYSSPNYGGLRRGTFFTDNSFLHSGKAGSFSGRISVMDNRPNYLSKRYNEYINMTSEYGSQTYELGVQKAFKRIQIGLYPYYFAQKIQQNSFMANEGVAPTWRSQSARLRLMFNYQDVKQNLNLNIDNGYTYQNTSDLPPAPFLSSKVNLQYRNNIFGFSGYYQHNAYYISDVLANAGKKNYNVLSAGPNIGFSGLDKRLSGTASAMYNYYGYNGNQNYTLNGYVRYLLKGDWAITANAYYGLNRQERMMTYNPETGLDYKESAYSYRDFAYFSNRQFSFGIEKHFGNDNNHKTRRLRLTYFDDLNGNGIQDNGEKVVPGILVKINGLAAITNTSGTVQFVAPIGEYSPEIVNQNGWVSIGSGSVQLTKNRAIEIGLVKTAKLEGRIQIQKDKYIDDKVSLAGIRVTAVGDAGASYTARCNAAGKFNFYLPEGKFMIYVKNEDNGIRILNERLSVQVKRTVQNEIVFNAKNEKVIVDVKKF